MPPELEMFFVCERCFSADERPGTCPRCGQPRREFVVGPPGDPRRQPPLDAEGHMLCRAPLWWVSLHAPYLRQRPATAA
jgi:hypothetical protein